MSQRKNNKYIFRLWSTRFSTVLSVALVLFMLGLGVLFAYHSYVFSNELRENISFLIHFKPDTKEEQALALSEELRKDPRVKNIDFVTKEQAAKIMNQLLGDEHLDVFQGEIPYDLSAVVYLFAQDLHPNEIARFIANIQAKDIVNIVDYQDGLIKEINTAVYNAAIVIFVLFLCLLFIVITLINQTVRLTIYSKRFLIRTMELVGARGSTIRRPFLWIGVKMGLIGGLLAVLLLAGLVVWGVKSFSLTLSPNTLKIYLLIGASLIVFGIMLSFFCNILAVYRYMRTNTDKLYT